uniref:(northern house mosquito) hypothetical protein n=1 Tax=Culex pipiens TaxID=7175 RepID=A0A8D8KAH7_CULPI
MMLYNPGCSVKFTKTKYTNHYSSILLTFLFNLTFAKSYSYSFYKHFTKIFPESILVRRERNGAHAIYIIDTCYLSFHRTCVATKCCQFISFEHNLKVVMATFVKWLSFHLVCACVGY